MALQPQGSPQLFRQEDRDRELRAALQPSGCSDCQDRGSHTRSVGRATQWGGQKNEGSRKGLWLVKVFFNAFPASPACFMFKKLQLPSLPQPSCTKQEMLTAGGSRLHSITQTKSNPGIFVLLPSHTWLAPTLMLLRGMQCTEWFTNYGTNSADLPLKNFLWSQWD